MRRERASPARRSDRTGVRREQKNAAPARAETSASMPVRRQKSTRLVQQPRLTCWQRSIRSAAVGVAKRRGAAAEMSPRLRTASRGSRPIAGRPPPPSRPARRRQWPRVAGCRRQASQVAAVLPAAPVHSEPASSGCSIRRTRHQTAAGDPQFAPPAQSHPLGQHVAVAAFDFGQQAAVGGQHRGENSPAGRLQPLLQSARLADRTVSARSISISHQSSKTLVAHSRSSDRPRV